MLVNKFPYQKLTRKSIDGSRVYACPDGTGVASVTTILAATKTEKAKKTLQQWRERVGPVNATKISVAASSRGTRLHTFLENYANNDSIGDAGTNPHSQESHRMAQHIVDSAFHKITEFYGTEVSLYFPQLYAGTTDNVALYDGELAIIDYKQTNKLKKLEWIDDYLLQLVAYGISHDELYGTQIRRGVVMLCTPDLQFQQFEITPDNYNKYCDLWWGKLHQYYENKGKNEIQSNSMVGKA